MPDYRVREAVPCAAFDYRKLYLLPILYFRSRKIAS